MEKELKKLLPFDLQFFADEEDPDEDDSTEEEKGKENETEDDDEGKNSPKTFTQEEVNKMMAAEKKKGKRSVYKSLGFNSEEELKSAVETGKTPEQKRDVKKEDLEGSKKAEERATLAENKLVCFMAGVSKDSIEDVLAIACKKIDDEKDLEDVLEEMKKQKKYQGLFSDSNNEDDSKGKGTGKNPNPKKKDESKPDYGKTIAEKYYGNSKNDKEQKSSYFSR